MKEFYSSLSFKIWLPYFVVILFIFAVVKIYYPEEQTRVLEKQQRTILYQIAQSIGFSVETAIQNQDYSLIYKSYQSLSEINDLDILIITQFKDGKELEFTKFPNNATLNLKDIRKSQFLCSACKYQSKILNGNVIACSKKSHTVDLVSSLNKPAYIILLIALILVFISYYYLTSVVAKPILETIRITKKIEKGDLNISIPHKRAGDEIGEMYKALDSLRISLHNYKTSNELLTSGLESAVEEKTRQLNEALKNLQNAQRLAKIGSFTYSFIEDSFTTSSSLDEILGISVDSTKKYSSLIKMVDDQDLPDLKESLRSLLSTKRQISVDFRVLKPETNTEIWVTMLLEVGLIDENKRVLTINGTIQDISRKREAEQELRKLSLVAKNTTNSVIITDKEKRIIWVNESVTKQTGYSFEELIGKKPKLFQFNKTDKNVLNQISEELGKLKPVTAELENIGKHGNTYWLKLYIQPYFDEYGDHIGFMAIEVDITEQILNKRKLEELNLSLEKRIKERTIELEQSNDSLKNFAHAIAHDLKAPARHINGFANSLKERISNKIETDERKILDNVLISAKKMIALIDGLLEFSKVGSQALKFRKVDLNSSVLRIINMQLSDNQKAKYKIHVEHFPQVLCDEILIEQVLSNLVSNAIKYSSKKDNPTIEITYKNENQFHIISVKDNGCGFDMKFSSNLFKMFTRLHSFGDFEGFGIGLATANKIVERHGGRITFDSKPDVGTIFNVHIPVILGSI